MVHPKPHISRAFSGRLLAPRKKIAACLIILFFVVFSIIIFTSSNGKSYTFKSAYPLKRRRVELSGDLQEIDSCRSPLSSNSKSSRLQREEHLEEILAQMQSHLQFLEAQYRGRLEDIISLQAKMFSDRGNNSSNHLTALDSSTSTVAPAVQALLENLSGTMAAAGIHTKYIQQLRIPFVYQLLPHLMNDPNSLKPAFHMRGRRHFSDMVVGIPTVKRDKMNYLMLTLTHLVKGLTPADINSTLIVVMIGETDLEYVIKTARQIELLFPKQVENGLIEVISPSAAYYPDFDTLPVTLGDSHKRVKWRTKQNLDYIYLMAYAQSKGTFYLMLEDDVIARKNYVQEIKQFTTSPTVANRNWFFIEYCHVGGIGKLFRSADLIHFVTYVQLFYTNMPIDWLLESYLADRTCTILKSSKKCAVAKEAIRPKYKSSLFQHIGLYSSLKGKIQKIKDTHFGPVPTFYPHRSNPPLQSLKTDIVVHARHPLQGAYEGHSFFWGEKPKNGNVVEFWFEKPIVLAHYTFRSGNILHVQDKFYGTTVEVLPTRGNATFTPVNTFDEFGLAEGDLAMGHISAIRLKVNKNSNFWVILSEIELKEYQPPDKGR